MTKATFIKTGRPEFDGFWPLLAGLIQKNALDVVVDGQSIRGYRAPDAPSFWIRDYSDMLRALKYMEADVCSLVRHFADTQAENGRIFDYFTVFPEKLPCERENWCKYVRVPVEADVEYRFVKAAFLAWQAAGDDSWLQRLLPKMEKALHYILDHPWYWQPETGLVKRAYTIDTWDFAYTAGRHDWLQFQIDDHTFWGYMHGDNSGYYQAFRIMETLYGYFGDSRRAASWRERADRLRRNMNRVCWNGRFYTHFVKITPVAIEGVAEAGQLSLSNPMAVNRGVTSRDMAASIIREYRHQPGGFICRCLGLQCHGLCSDRRAGRDRRPAQVVSKGRDFPPLVGRRHHGGGGFRRLCRFRCRYRLPYSLPRRSYSTGCRNPRIGSEVSCAAAPGKGRPYRHCRRQEHRFPQYDGGKQSLCRFYPKDKRRHPP